MRHFFSLIDNIIKNKNRKSLVKSCLRFYLVIPKRFERLTHALEGRCSIQLSYGTILKCGAKVVLFLKPQKELNTFFTTICTTEGYNPKGKSVIYHKINNKVQAIKM